MTMIVKMKMTIIKKKKFKTSLFLQVSKLVRKETNPSFVELDFPFPNLLVKIKTRRIKPHCIDILSHQVGSSFGVAIIVLIVSCHISKGVICNFIEIKHIAHHF